MKKFIATWIITISSLLCFSTILHAEHQEQIIVGFEEEVDLTVLDEVNYELVHIYDVINAAVIKVPTKEVVKEIKRLPEITWVESDQTAQVAEQKVNWGFEVTEVQKTQALEITGKGVKIGILDTGVNLEHPDLEIASGISFVGNRETYHDDNGHGTHVAGIINAQPNDIGTVGVAPDADVYAIKVLDQNGDGTISTIVEGIEWAIEQDIDIINLSFTIATSPKALEEVIKKANETGIIIVASSGNYNNTLNRNNEDVLYPAKYPEVLAVGSVNKELRQSGFSYFGPNLAYSAPGEDIYSTYRLVDGYSESYVMMTGTSMATPYVAGVIALYKQIFPTFTNEKLLEVINEEVRDLGEEGRDDRYGYGLIMPPKSRFIDTKDKKWYTEYIDYVSRENLIKGFTDGTFRPGAKITRGEVVTLVGRVLGLNNQKQATSYADVSKDYYASGYIHAATKEGIITGLPNNTFKPRRTISRGEVAVILYRAFDLPLSEEHAFMDVKEGKYYTEAINSLYEEKIITGYENHQFKPDEKISRAEFTAILARILKEGLRD